MGHHELIVTQLTIMCLHQSEKRAKSPVLLPHVRAVINGQERIAELRFYDINQNARLKTPSTFKMIPLNRIIQKDGSTKGRKLKKGNGD